MTARRPAPSASQRRRGPLERDEMGDEEWERAMGRRIEDVFGHDDDGEERRAT